MSSFYYRIIVGNRSLRDAVDKKCPRGDSRRFDRPDSSWLLDFENKYPGSISYLTRQGMSKMIDTGLLDWQLSIHREDVFVVITAKPKKVFYTDDYQVICDPNSVEFKKVELISDFVKKFNQRI